MLPSIISASARIFYSLGPIILDLFQSLGNVLCEKVIWPVTWWLNNSPPPIFFKDWLGNKMKKGNYLEYIFASIGNVESAMYCVRTDRAKASPPVAQRCCAWTRGTRQAQWAREDSSRAPSTQCATTEQHSRTSTRTCTWQTVSTHNFADTATRTSRSAEVSRQPLPSESSSEAEAVEIPDACVLEVEGALFETSC